MRFLFLLALTVSGKSHGGDRQSGAFWRPARRRGLWPAAAAGHRSAITNARAPLSWTAVEPRPPEAVRRTDGLWPAAAEDPWQGLSVFALEGARYPRPAAAAWRQAFDPDRGLDPPGKGHYPHGLVSTGSALLRRLPSARPVRPIALANERDEVKARRPVIPRGGVLRFDRGSPSDDLLEDWNRHYAGYGRFRGPAQSTFPAVEALVRSGHTEAMSTRPCSPAQTCTRRAIRLTRPAGTVSGFLTNRIDTPRFSAAALMALSFRRWGVDTHSRAEKTSMALDTFHRQTENGIRQELLASLLRAGIARLRMRLTTAPDHPARADPQFKQAILTLATAADRLTPPGPE